jgi:hypothetical protein
VGPVLARGARQPRLARPDHPSLREGEISQGLQRGRVVDGETETRGDRESEARARDREDHAESDRGGVPTSRRWISTPPIHLSADVGLTGLSVPFLAEVSGAVEIHLGKRSATTEGKGDERSIKQALQGAPHHLPVLRIRRACPSSTGLRPVRLLRNASARLRAGDLAGGSPPARRSGHPPLRVRPSRDARAARRGVSLPGMQVRGLAHRSSGHRHTKKEVTDGRLHEPRRAGGQ